MFYRLVIYVWRSLHYVMTVIGVKHGVMFCSTVLIQTVLGGHAVGNLLIVAIWRLLHDELEGLDLVGRLLGIHGRVVPMSTTPLQIEAQVLTDDGSSLVIKGQGAVASSRSCIEQLHLIPQQPPTIQQLLTQSRMLTG